MRKCSVYQINVFLGVELVPLSGAIVSPRKIVVNKPFLFIVRDKKMKIPLFVGNVVDPSLASKN